MRLHTLDVASHKVRLSDLLELSGHWLRVFGRPTVERSTGRTGLMALCILSGVRSPRLTVLHAAKTVGTLLLGYYE